jgi:hypothetical protein
MNKEQSRWYSKYISRRSLGMPASDFKPLLLMYNDIFNKDIDFDTFMNSGGAIHKIVKIESKLDKKYKTK